VAATSLGQILEDPTLPAPRQEGGFTPSAASFPKDAGITAVLNLDFVSADSIFSARSAADPASPAGEFGLGLSAWWKLVSGMEGASSADVERHLEQAMTISKRFAELPGKRAEALYYSGRSSSLLSAIYLIENRKVQAAKSAQRSQSYLSLCLKEDPKFVDANLGLGLYHYYADALPRFFKFFGWLVGIKGNRDLGLRELRAAAQGGATTQPEALYFLTNVLTNFEGRPDEAILLIRVLSQAYPRNHVFFVEYQNCLESLGYYPEAEDAYTRALAPGGAFEGARAVRLMLGRNLLRQARYEESAKVFEAELTGPADRTDPALPWFFYFAARSRDLLGQWEAALKHYKAAAAFKTGGNVAGLAEQRMDDRESDGMRRVRFVRGLTNQRGKSREAAEAWSALRAEVEAGRLKVDPSIDAIRFRQALSYEEAGDFAKAREAYRAVQTTQDLLVRSGIGIARCYWREGEASRAKAILDSLHADPSFPGKALAARAVKAIGAVPCAKAPPADRGLQLLYRDPEAWGVTLHYDTGSGEACLPMRFTDGVWECRVPESVRMRRYYFRVDATRREPDPLSRWEPGDRGLVWSLVPSPAERAQWSERVER